MRSFCTAKAPHIFSAKNGSVFMYNMFEILTSRLTNDVEQLGPGSRLMWINSTTVETSRNSNKKAIHGSTLLEGVGGLYMIYLKNFRQKIEFVQLGGVRI